MDMLNRGTTGITCSWNLPRFTTRADIQRAATGNRGGPFLCACSSVQCTWTPGGRRLGDLPSAGGMAGANEARAASESGSIPGTRNGWTAYDGGQTRSPR